MILKMMVVTVGVLVIGWGDLLLERRGIIKKGGKVDPVTGGMAIAFAYFMALATGGFVVLWLVVIIYKILGITT